MRNWETATLRRWKVGSKQQRETEKDAPGKKTLATEHAVRNLKKGVKQEDFLKKSPYLQTYRHQGRL